MRYKLFTLMIVLLLSIVSGCEQRIVKTDQQDLSLSQTYQNDEATYVFKAYVQEVNDNYMLVVPFKETTENTSSGLFYIDLTKLTDDCLPSIGDVYEITYNGMIEETYPAKLSKIYSVKCSNEGSDLANIDHIRSLEDDTYYKLYEIDIDALYLVLSAYDWIEGTSDCLSEYELVVNNNKYVYHKDCGTFNDTINQKSITLSQEDREYVNGLIEQCVNIRQWNGVPLV